MSSERDEKIKDGALSAVLLFPRVEEVEILVEIDDVLLLYFSWV